MRKLVIRLIVFFLFLWIGKVVDYYEKEHLLEAFYLPSFGEYYFSCSDLFKTCNSDNAYVLWKDSGSWVQGLKNNDIFPLFTYGKDVEDRNKKKNYPGRFKVLSPYDNQIFPLTDFSQSFNARWEEEYTMIIPTSWLQDYEFITYNHSGVDLQLCFRGVNMLPFWKDQEQLLSFWKRGCEKIPTGTFFAIKNIDMQQLEKFDYLQARIKPLGYVDTLITLVLRKNDNL